MMEIESAEIIPFPTRGEPIKPTDMTMVEFYALPVAVQIRTWSKIMASVCKAMHEPFRAFWP
jgi:hypothetical protein